MELNNEIIHGVTFILLRPDGTILMQERDDGRGDEVILYPDAWNIPGGGSEPGETPVATTIREVQEEFEIDLVENQCEFLLNYTHDGNIADALFICNVSQDVHPIMHEGRSMQWMSMDEIKKLDLAWEQNKIVPQIEQKLLELLQKPSN